MSLRLVDLADARVAIWGCGREGRAALAVLRRRFPEKLLAVFCSAAEADGLKARDGLGNDSDTRLQLITTTADAETLTQFDVVIKSPGISPYKPPAAPAQCAGVRFTSATALWFAEHPDARTICVTGTKGKAHGHSVDRAHSAQRWTTCRAGRKHRLAAARSARRRWTGSTACTGLVGDRIVEFFRPAISAACRPSR
jgi:hypothetical protein